MPMTRDEVQQLLELRNMADAVLRGRVFEQSIRELLPWDVRPPLALLAKGEQFDAFYEWNSWHFLVEAKAKHEPIVRASHDWEDFELKVRKRRGSCIGLFVSLYPVSTGLIEAADQLNREGFPTLVLPGDFWDELLVTWVPLEDVLHYLVLHAKAQHKATAPDLSDVRAWCHDEKKECARLQSACRMLSAPFLRRYAHPRHSLIYVAREIDAALREMARVVSPTALAQVRASKHRTHRLKNEDRKVEYEGGRRLPYQICTLRDSSGAGKTTLATQIALTTDPYLGIARSATEQDIDSTATSLQQLGPAFGLHSLVEINKPIVCAIDSLDEATNIPGKTNEVKGLIDSIVGLNRVAEEGGLIGFPILLLFTIREDYWSRWQYIFEGRECKHYRNVVTRFSGEEFDAALTAYSKAYRYVVMNPPGGDAVATLAVPFNLGIFSEANEYADPVSFTDVFEERVLQLYFERKQENIVRRRVPGLTGEAFMRLGSELAMCVLKTGTRTVTKKQIGAILKRHFPALCQVFDDVVLAFVSENILIRDPENPTVFLFRHSRPMEYLIAHQVVRSFDEGKDPLRRQTTDTLHAGFVSMFRIHDFVRFICKHESPHLLESVLAAYAKSDEYMSKRLMRPPGRHCPWDPTGPGSDCLDKEVVTYGGSQDSVRCILYAGRKDH